MNENSPIICPLCSKENDPASRICIECGENLLKRRNSKQPPEDIQNTEPEIPTPFLKVEEALRVGKTALGVLGSDSAPPLTGIGRNTTLGTLQRPAVDRG